MPPNISVFSAFTTNEVTWDQNWNLKSHNLPSPKLPSHPRIPVLYKVTPTPRVFGVLFRSHWPTLPGATHPHGLWVPKQFQALSFPGCTQPGQVVQGTFRCQRSSWQNHSPLILWSYCKTTPFTPDSKYLHKEFFPRTLQPLSTTWLHICLNKWT